MDSIQPNSLKELLISKQKTRTPHNIIYIIYNITIVSKGGGLQLTELVLSAKDCAY